MRNFLLALLLTAATAHAADNPNPIRAYRTNNEQKILTELRTLLAIPNVATDTPNIERNAALLADMLRKRGIEPQLLRVDGAPPVVFGELRAPGAKETLVFYAHYDGQPVDRSKWNSDPWVPIVRSDSVERGGRDVAWENVTPESRVFARSASDDKAPIVAMLTAIDALRAAKIPLRVNLKFFFEGEEEAGSPHLGAILEKHKALLGGDLWLIGDGPVHQSRRMQLYYGVRGVMGVELTTYGPARPLHSGHYGNWAPNPIVTMAHLIASLRDEEGRILIDDFYDDVRALSAADRAALAEVPPADDELKRELALGRTEGSATLNERIAVPALNVRGIRGGNVGETAANVISTEASASIDFRLVADQTPARIREKTEAHLRKRGWHIVYETPDAATRREHAKLVKLEWEGGYPASRLPLDHPIAADIERRIESATGQQVIKLPTLGGSVPLYLLKEKLAAQSLGIPTVNHDNNQHGANENLRVQNLWDAVELFAAVVGREK